MRPIVIAFVSALLLGSILHVLAVVLFPRLGFLDFPERYGLKRHRLPYPSGILAVIAFLMLFPIFFEITFQNMGLMAAVAVLAVTCFIDDRKQLSPILRLLVQIAVGLLIFLTGTRIYSLTNPLEVITGMPVLPLDSWVITSTIFSNPSIIGAVFTIFWLGLTMNAMNWFDGIPGQMSTLSTIGFGVIGFLALSSRVNQPEVAMLSFILCGLALSCLLFDFPPARVIIGDSGSMFFGLMLGVLTIYAGGKVATAFLVLGVPLIDLFLVILQRLLKGRSPLHGNMEHLHHRLLQKGWSPLAVIMLTAGLGTLFGVSALFLSTTEKLAAAALLFLVMLGLLTYARPKQKRASAQKRDSW